MAPTAMAGAWSAVEPLRYSEEQRRGGMEYAMRMLLPVMPAHFEAARPVESGRRLRDYNLGLLAVTDLGKGMPG